MSVNDGNDERDMDREEVSSGSAASVGSAVSATSTGTPQSASSPASAPSSGEFGEPGELDGATGNDSDEPAESDGVDEPASGTALSDDPVLVADPELPNDDAPKPASAQDPAGASAEFNDEPAEDRATATRDRNWMGYAAFATGALALSVVAIVLGHLGLKARRQGRATNRDFALAGLILGYVGLVATAVGLWFLLSDQTTPAHVDVYAQQDVSAVGAAAATSAIETGEVPEVTLTETGYLVAGEPIDAHLTGARTLTLTGEGMAGWCLEMAYEGGEQATLSYTATSGMAQGRCAG